MARKTVAELLAEIIAMFPDNTTGAITPDVLRSFLDNVVESYAPAFAYFSQQIPVPLGVVGASFVTIQGYNGLGAAQSPWMSNGLLGTLTQPEIPNAAQISVQAVLDFAVNDEVELAVFVNGMNSGYIAQSVSGRGPGRPVSVSFTGIVGDASAASVIDVRIRSLSGNASPTLNSIAVVAQTITVRS